MQECDATPPCEAHGGDIASEVARLRAAIVEETRLGELAEIERELAELEAQEGLTSSELVARISRGELSMTMRRAWWLAQWRLRARLRGECP